MAAFEPKLTLGPQVYRWHLVGVHTCLLQHDSSAFASVGLVIYDCPVAPVLLSFGNQDIVGDADAVQRKMAIAWTVRFHQADSGLLSFAASNECWKNKKS
jgi:hypothetical protein